MPPTGLESHTARLPAQREEPLKAVSENPPAIAQSSSHDSPAPPPSATAGRTIDGGRGRVFPCPQCGGELVFNIGDQHLKCPHCGFEKEIAVPKDAAVVEQDFRAMLAQLEKELRLPGRRPKAGAIAKSRPLRELRRHGRVCRHADQSASARTAVRQSSVNISIREAGGSRSTASSPFLVVRERAAGSFSKWIGSRWFAPSGFAKRAESGKFNGVYLPFWTFDAVTASSYRGQRGNHYFETVGSGDNRRQEQRTRWSSPPVSFSLCLTMSSSRRRTPSAATCSTG